MKKRIAILMSCLCILSLAGCNQTTDSPQEDVTIQATTTPETPVPESTVTEVPEAFIVRPLPCTIDLTNLQDCTLSVSLDKGDIFADEKTGTLKMNATVFDYEVFDLVDVSMLEVGSILEIDQKQVEITELETNAFGTVIINGGLDVGGYELFTNENGVYYSIGYSDAKTYFEVGEIQLELSPEFVYTDESDLDAEPTQYTVNDTEVLEYEGTPRNTTIVIENGLVTSLMKVYIP